MIDISIYKKIIVGSKDTEVNVLEDPKVPVIHAKFCNTKGINKKDSSHMNVIRTM